MACRSSIKINHWKRVFLWISTFSCHNQRFWQGEILCWKRHWMSTWKLEKPFFTLSEFFASHNFKNYEELWNLIIYLNSQTGKCNLRTWNHKSNFWSNQPMDLLRTKYSAWFIINMGWYQLFLTNFHWNIWKVIPNLQNYAQ